MNQINKQKLIPILSGLLLLQLVVAAAFNLGGGGYSPAAENKSLAEIDPGSVDRIRIANDESKVELVRLDDQWQVAELDFPADSESVSNLLTKLSELEVGLPVATTDEAAERFKVNEENFERRVVLLQGDKVITELFFGTVPALRKVHARLSGDDNIYSVEFNTFDARAGKDDWIDKAILERDIADITRAELPVATLVRQEDGVVVEGLNEDQETNAEEAESLLKKVAELEIQSVLGKSLDDPGKAVDTFKLKLKDGREINYDISKPEDQHYYVLKSSDQPFYFKVGTYKINPILNMEREKLVQAKQAEETKEDTTAVAAKEESEDKS